MAAGDSGNDRDMLEGEHLSIVVGNAHDELMQWARGSPGARDGSLLITRGHRARGILEALESFGFK